MTDDEIPPVGPPAGEDRPAWMGPPSSGQAPPPRPLPRGITAPTAAAAGPAPKRSRTSVSGLLVVVLVLAIIGGLIWAGTRELSDKDDSAASKSTTTTTATTTTTEPALTTTTGKQQTSSFRAPRPPEKPTGSTEAFCALGDTFERAVTLLAQAGQAPTVLQAERVAEQAFPLFEQLMKAAPQQVFQPVGQLYIYAGAVSIWSDADLVWDRENPEPPDKPGRDRSLERTRQLFLKVPAAAREGHEAQAIRQFLATCP